MTYPEEVKEDLIIIIISIEINNIIIIIYLNELDEQILKFEQAKCSTNK
jgi:hypothetical protein